jgi:sugar-specific transcriptional regulator TrmB
MDNNHKEVIATLEEKGLIFKNPQSSDIYPIYNIDRVLIKDDFSTELDVLLGSSWQTLKSEYKQVLNAIYWHNAYSFESESVSANSIGAFIYLKINKQIRDITEYDNFKRKIRGVFNQLEAKGFIVRKDGKSKEMGGKPDFKINEHFERENTLF